MAVDILPASIPLDASNHFSKALYPYLESLIESYKAGGALSPALERGTTAAGGKLVEKHKWLWENVEKFRAAGPETAAVPAATTSATHDDGVVIGSMGALRKKRVLLFGSGMVAGPAVEEIARRGDVQLLIGMQSSRNSSSSC